jgi:hypothetical protein
MDSKKGTFSKPYAKIVLPIANILRLNAIKILKSIKLKPL